MGEEGKRARPLSILVRPSHARLLKRPSLALLLAANPVRHTRHGRHRQFLVLSESATSRDFAFVSTSVSPLLTLVASHLSILELADAAGRSASTVATMDVEMNEADSLEALSGVLERLTENPYDISLHVEHIRIARATGMDDHVDSALEMMTVFWAAGDGVWLPLIAHKIAASNLESPEDLQSILDLFTRAERDYLCE